MSQKKRASARETLESYIFLDFHFLIARAEDSEKLPQTTKVNTKA